MEEGKGRVCVTGGTIGSWLIKTKRLLEDGYSVNTTATQACLNFKTVKRVVYTSSTAAVICSGKEEQAMDESFWSDVDYLRSSKMLKWSYAISKTLTEKAVLEFGEGNGLDVVSVAPPLVLGTFICPKLPNSVCDALNLAFGT